VYGEQLVGDRAWPNGVSPWPNSARHISERVIRLASAFLARWSWVAAVRDRLAMSLMTTDHEAAYALLDAVHSPRAKMKAIGAAVRAVRPTDGDLVEWALQQLPAIERYRDRFAHDLWIGVQADADLLILVRTAHLSAHFAAARSLRWEVVSPTARRASMDAGTARRIRWVGQGVMYTSAILESLANDAGAAYALMDAVEVMLSDWPEYATHAGEFPRAAEIARERLLGWQRSRADRPGLLSTTVPSAFPPLPE
jgi:hypothetical protein